RADGDVHRVTLHGPHVLGRVRLGLVRLVGLHLALAAVHHLGGGWDAQPCVRVHLARLADGAGDSALVDHQRLRAATAAQCERHSAGHRPALTTTAPPPKRAANRSRVAGGSSIGPPTRSPTVTVYCSL